MNGPFLLALGVLPILLAWLAYDAYQLHRHNKRMKQVLKRFGEVG